MNTILKLKRMALAASVSLAGAASAQAQEVVKIGYTGPMSGGAALYGKNVLEGMQMAANEINSAGLEVAGKKYKVEIVAMDDKYNPSESAINAQRLVQEQKTAVILVAHSGGTFALQTNNEQQKYLILSYSSVPQITARGNKLTFRIVPDFTSYIQPFVRYSMAKYGKNLAIACADHDHAKAWIAAFKPAWEAAGGKVVAENPMSYTKAADFYSGVSRALASKPDVMFIGGPSEPTALVVKQARELGFKGGFVMIDQSRADEMAKVLSGYAAMDGSIGVMPLTEITTPSARSFVDRFQKVNGGRLPTWDHSLNYNAVRIAVEAMRLAGSVSDAVAIRAQLDAAAKRLPGTANPHDIEGVSAAGASSMAVQIGVVEGNKVVSRAAQDIR